MKSRRLSAHCLAVITVLATIIAGTPAVAADDAACDGPWLSAMQAAGEDAGALSSECGEENRAEEEVESASHLWIDPAPHICLFALHSTRFVPPTSRGVPLGVGATLSIRGPPTA